MNVWFQVSVGYVSRGSEGGCPPSTSTSTPPLSLPLLIPWHEPHFRRHGCTRTAAVLHDSIPTCCSSTTTAYTGTTDRQTLIFAAATTCSSAATIQTGSHVSPSLPFALCRHQYRSLAIVQRQKGHQEAELCSPPPPPSRFRSSPILQTSVSFRPSLLLNSHPACRRSISTASRDR